MWRVWGSRESLWQNITVSVLIVVVHVLVLRIQWLAQIRKPSTGSVSLLYFLPLLEPPPVIADPARLNKTQQASGPIDVPVPMVATVLPAEVTTQNKVETTAPPSTSSPKIDWREASKQVAAEIVKRSENEAYRSLDSRPALKETPPADDGQNGIFPPPLHKAGETQRLDNGEVITWLNDRCYMTNRPPASANERKVGPVCKRLSKTARSDLFEQFKPGYLRTPVEELPIPKAAQ